MIVVGFIAAAFLAGFLLCALLASGKRRDVDITDAFTERRMHELVKEREAHNPGLRGGRR